MSGNDDSLDLSDSTTAHPPVSSGGTGYTINLTGGSTTDDDGDDETEPPGPSVDRGQTFELNGHALDAVESKLPRETLVWACQQCGLRSATGEDFLEGECEAAD